jgi:hypothetical protein
MDALFENLFAYLLLSPKEQQSIIAANLANPAIIAEAQTLLQLCGYPTTTQPSHTPAPRHASSKN